MPTASDPADKVSWGCDVNEINKSNWFSGPEFLKWNVEDWPINQHFTISPKMFTFERKRTKVSVLNIECTAENKGSTTSQRNSKDDKSSVEHDWECLRECANHQII